LFVYGSVRMDAPAIKDWF